MREGSILADIRLSAYELPDKFENVRLGQKMLVKIGPHSGKVVKVIGRLHERGLKYVFCKVL